MLYGAHLSNGKFKMIKYFSSRCFPTWGLSGLKWRSFKLREIKIKVWDAAISIYLPWTSWHWLAFPTSSMRKADHMCLMELIQCKEKKEIKKNTTQKTQTHFAFRKSFKTIKILWSAHLCPLHYATNAGYLTTGQSSFLALPIYIFITPLNSYFYSLLHSHLWHYKYVSSLFCCGGLVFMPSATHLASSNQPPEFQKQT